MFGQVSGSCSPIESSFNIEENVTMTSCSNLNESEYMSCARKEEEYMTPIALGLLTVGSHNCS